MSLVRRRGGGLPPTRAVLDSPRSELLCSARAQAVEQVAIGSQITFLVEAETGSGQRQVCAMWLSSAGKKFGLTGDASYFRSYMGDVEKRLRELDPQLELVKS